MNVFLVSIVDADDMTPLGARVYVGLYKYD